jgi:hypothetical protein
MTWSRSFLVCAILLTLGLAGCDRDRSGASSPEAAVEQFLEPFAEDYGSEAPTATEEVQEFWASTCARVDPRIRPRLRFYDGPVDPDVNCGALVVLLVADTGDTSGMASPSKILGTPVSAETSLDESIVTVDMRYEVLSEPARRAPPAKARIKVLVIKRHGSWWVATPQAFNPRSAAEGGLSESELRDQHKELLTAESE